MARTGAPAFWTGRGACRFVDDPDAMSPLTARLLARAAPRAGEHVVDIGCGAGTTSRVLSECVGRRGSVLGVDVSAPLLAIARTRVRAANVRFVHADAAAYAYAPASLDLVVSQFGMTFFAAPALAFASFQRALVPAGRLVFTCYGPVGGNAWLRTISRAARATVPGWRAPRLDRAVAGPFAFADRRRIVAVLAAAGFARVRITACTAREPLAATLDDAVAAAFARPLVVHLLASLADHTRAAIRARARRAIARYAVPGGFAFPAAAWLVAAIKPAAARRPGARSPASSARRSRR